MPMRSVHRVSSISPFSLTRGLTGCSLQASLCLGLQEILSTLTCENRCHKKITCSYQGQISPWLSPMPILQHSVPSAAFTWTGELKAPLLTWNLVNFRKWFWSLFRCYIGSCVPLTVFVVLQSHFPNYKNVSLPPFCLKDPHKNRGKLLRPWSVSVCRIYNENRLYVKCWT